MVKDKNPDSVDDKIRYYMTEDDDLEDAQQRYLIDTAIAEQANDLKELRENHGKRFTEINNKRINYKSQLDQPLPEFKEQLEINIKDCVKNLDQEINYFNRKEFPITQEMKDYIVAKKGVDKIETDEKINNPSLAPQSKLSGIVDVKDYLPNNTQWEDIVISIVDEDTIKIICQNIKLDLRYSQTEEFLNKKTKTGNHSWELLKELSLLGVINPNEINYEYFKKFHRRKDYMYDLSKALKALFGINENPFLRYNPKDGWIPKFQINDKRLGMFDGQIAAKRFNIENRLNKRARRQPTPTIGGSFNSDSNEIEII